MGQQFMDLLTVIGMLLLMILVFVGAYFVSRFVGGSYASKRGQCGERVEILDRTMMGRDKSLVIIRVAGKVLLLGVTPQQITKVDELEPTCFPDVPSQPPSNDFKTILQDAWKQRTGKRDKGDGTQE